MIQLIGIGIWACIVSISAAYGTVLYLQRPAQSRGPSELEHIEHIKTKLIIVPMASNEGVEGYMRVQFAFSVEKTELEKLPIKPDIILVDEAYRSMAEYRFLDPKRPTRAEVNKITEQLKTALHNRIGSALVRDIWVQDYSFIASQGVRGAAVQ